MYISTSNCASEIGSFRPSLDSTAGGWFKNLAPPDFEAAIVKPWRNAHGHWARLAPSLGSLSMAQTSDFCFTGP